MAFMALSRWDAQPNTLGYEPPRYPSHDFKGTGTVWRVLAPDGVVVGTLSYTGSPAEAVEWQVAEGLDDAQFEIASAVFILLLTGAGEDRSLVDTLDEVYALAGVRVLHNAELGVLRP